MYIYIYIPMLNITNFLANIFSRFYVQDLIDK